MIEQLKAAGDQLRTAWDTYCNVYSTFHNYDIQRKIIDSYDFTPELSRQLDTELAFMSSYELKIQEMRVGISRARNYSSGLAPITSLPSELMSHIFHLVASQSCDLHQLSGDKTCYPRYPDYLAHVCALWRHIAISCGSLWRHIDLSPYEPYSAKLLTRARVHSVRAGEVPIELHISDNELSYLEGPYYAYNNMYQLLSRMPNRMKALEFVLTRELGGFHRGILSRLFLGQRPTLTKLVVRSKCDHFDTFIVDDGFFPGELERGFRHLPLDVRKEQLETYFTPLTVLHLHGIFPLWTSTAYQGLVDLRLLSTSRRSHITETNFIAILKSSPALQILHFGLEIRDSTPDAVQITPVDLPGLRVIKIFPFTNRHEKTLSPSSVLRLLAPGTKPLRLSFNDYYESDSIIELERFFARSRVVKFYARLSFPPLSLLLRHAARLNCVVFDEYTAGDYQEYSHEWLPVDEAASVPHLKSLYILRSTLSEGKLNLLREYCPTGLVLQSCYIRFSSSGGSGSVVNATSVSGGFPGLRATDHDLYPSESPTASWDELD